MLGYIFSILHNNINMCQKISKSKLSINIKKDQYETNHQSASTA